MLLRLVLWNLADSKTTIEELRRYLRDESVDAFEDVPGLRFKAWISDEVSERWGAVYLWESREDAEQELPSRARELIGKEPDIGEEFDVEATIEGQFLVAGAVPPGPRVRVALSARTRHRRVRISPIRSHRGGGHGYLGRGQVL